MPKLPQISGKRLGQALSRVGFEMVGQKGSHMKFVRKSAGAEETIIVPNHKVIRKGTLGGILKRTRLEVKEL